MSHLSTHICGITGTTVGSKLAWKFLTVSAMFLIVTVGAWGQDNATITGTVTDPSGGLVASVKISLKNLATGQARQVISNTSGVYRFPDVGVGRHTLEAAMPGFQKFTKTDIVVNVAQTLQEDIPLKVGSAQETVTVEADALQVQSQTNEISNLISGEQVDRKSTRLNSSHLVISYA